METRKEFLEYANDGGRKLLNVNIPAIFKGNPLIADNKSVASFVRGGTGFECSFSKPVRLNLAEDSFGPLHLDMR